LLRVIKHHHLQYHHFQSTNHEESHKYVHVSHVGLQFCSWWIILSSSQTG
ncbi:unnamed protein product, partial [Callosobruchus maculatus]